jgi:hypothetical protein
VTDSKPAEKRHGGRPFQKGSDSRRNSRGNLNKEAQSWEIRFRNALARKLPPEKAADVLITAYKRGHGWAADEVNSRLMGKVTQPIAADMTVKGQVVFVMSRPKDKTA